MFFFSFLRGLKRLFVRQNTDDKDSRKNEGTSVEELNNTAFTRIKGVKGVVLRQWESIAGHLVLITELKT